jgi:putative DNA primase/helicase
VREWQDEIARPLEGCSNVALACATAFAAPLVHFADEQTGIDHIHGTSTSGKTIACAAGETVFGLPSAAEPLSGISSFGQTWKTASDNGIEAFARMRNGVGCFLDELGKAKKIKSQIVPMVYTLIGGNPTLRADSQGRLRDQPSFSAFGFSTGEYPLDHYLKEGDDTEGRRKRFVDIPALVGDGTSLENFSAKQIGEIARHLYGVFARLHGAVGQVYLRRVVPELGPAGARAKVDQYVGEWCERSEIAPLLGHDPQDDSVIRRLGLKAAALRIATEFELWPWALETSNRCIAAGCLRWANNKNPSVTTSEQTAAEQRLREAIIAAYAANRLLVLNKRPGKGGGLLVPAPEHAAMYEDLETFKRSGCGFVRRDGEKTDVLLYREVFRNFCAGCGMEHDAFVTYLRRAQLLEVKNAKIKGKTGEYYVLVGTFLPETTST